MITFKDIYGADLRIETSLKDGAAVWIEGGGGRHMKAEQVPGIIDAIREAAGLPKPVEYAHTDRDRDTVYITTAIDAPNAALLSGISGGVYVTAEELPGFVAKLYEAAGQPAPIILDRPKNADYSDRAKIHAGLIVEHGSGMVHLPGGSVSPRAARTIAALMVEMADAAVAEMTNEAVKGLASLIYGESDFTEATAESIARVVLAAGYTKAAQ